ncbi:Protein disulfide-isomerase A3 [Liparis tanakae]|uniref:Protein disulfide-isomerase A3 n=1 Tax=Liparis tanakae TaxID=230148 RepID=A0A4Z2GUV6_9TELE|nr:Protein disulfide-isomerase A3 [Liparis tanakae]
MAAAARLLPAVALALWSGFPAAVSSRRDALELGDADFDYLATEHETMLVMFYAPWCGHCKKLSPEFEKAATRLKGTVQLAKIFRNGRDSSPYDGPRSADGIYHSMKKQTGPDSVPLLAEEDLQTFTSHYDASVVGADGSRLPEFLRAAALLRDQFRFAHTEDLQLGREYGATSEVVLLFRPPRMSNKFEDSVVVFKDFLTIGSLRRFIRDNMVMKMATKYSRRGLTFSVANQKDFLSELEDEFGLGTSDGGGLPLVTIRTHLGHKYTMREEFTRDGRSLERFVEDFLAGRLKRFIRSEPVPEKNLAAVKVVVAESFDDVVKAGDKDVLIQYPTIYFAPVGKKDEPIRYEGGRELRDFLAFLKKEASHRLVVGGLKAEL